MIWTRVCSGDWIRPGVVYRRLVPAQPAERDKGQGGRSVCRVSGAEGRILTDLLWQQFSPQATLFAPVQGGGDRYQVGQDKGIAAAQGGRQKQQRFLDVRAKWSRFRIWLIRARLTWPSQAEAL